MKSAVMVAVLLFMAPGYSLFADPFGAPGRLAPPPSGPPVVWPRLDDKEQAEAVVSLKEYAEQTAAQLNCPLRMFETKYFLFYCEMPEQEAKKWAGLLDKMYERLAELFGIQKGENIWRGRALVFVFSKAETYRQYETDMAHTDPGFSAGMCHSHRNGFVRIAFYRQNDDGNFAHVLVHESVHGFIHRFRTSALVPNWANEGLAETIATELVPQRGRPERVKNMARSQLKLHGGQVGDFLELEHIEAWQYPVAETLCTYMIQADKRKYVDFIAGIKEGMSGEDALEKRFKVKSDVLLMKYGQSMGIGNLKR